jgi:hypothetical protein
MWHILHTIVPRDAINVTQPLCMYNNISVATKEVLLAKIIH